MNMAGYPYPETRQGGMGKEQKNREEGQEKVKMEGEEGP